MSDNFFVQHPEVMRYIMQHENAAQAVEDERWLPVIPVDYIIHTDSTPFCDDARCECHNLALNGQAFIERIEQPIADGLLTTDEGLRLYWGEQV